MQMKNSNKQSVAQEALLTDATAFHELSAGEYESSLLEVRSGMPAKEALNLSSTLMGSALEIMTSPTDEGMTTNHIFGVRFLIEASAALVDASVGPVEFGNRQGGAPMITKEQLQAVRLKRVDFGGIDDNLFQIHEGGDIEQTLGLAADFNCALATLCDRLDFSTNNNGDPVTCAELRALAHISNTACALIQSVRYGLRAEIAVGEQA